MESTRAGDTEGINLFPAEGRHEWIAEMLLFPKGGKEIWENC